MKQNKKRSKLRGCLTTIAIIIVVLALVCGVLVVTTTPLSQWLYAHNYYWQAMIDHLHGK